MRHGEDLRYEREQRGINQLTFAAMIGISASYLSSIESGRYTMPEHVAERALYEIAKYDAYQKVRKELEGTGTEEEIERVAHEIVNEQHEPRINESEVEVKEEPVVEKEQPVAEVVLLSKDNINPDHYKVGGIETIDYIKAKLTPEQFKGYLMGSVMKYTSRFQHKNGIEDLEKSKWFTDRLIQELKGDA